MIIVLRPPDLAGPLRIGATGQDTVDTLRQLGTPLVLCRATGSRPGWGVDRPSGLFIGVYFDAHDRVEAIELGRPGDNTGDAVTYNELDVFTTPAADLVTQLRRRTTVHEEHDGHVFTAPDLLLTFRRPTTLETPDDEDGRFFASVLLARPGYHD
ncbi:hypothetical protein AB0H83_15180 [Dactylosporangium sp. NPDC050688]|uniref:hypothetical protein n=1 Tax=Dactylosporangium sp. NPDC050688 TaxID=3157217 RepID=UPI0033E2BA9C